MTARASASIRSCGRALHDSLIRCPEYYDHHVAERSLLFSDRVIWSPGVPVLRDDRAGWLPEPVPADFLTAAAPNHGGTRLVLGAWGCGVFGNRPEVVAAAFAKHLKGDFAGVFDRVVFAVSDRDPGVRRPFEEAFDERMDR